MVPIASARPGNMAHVDLARARPSAPFVPLAGMRRCARMVAVALVAVCAAPDIGRAQKPAEGFQSTAPHAILIEADSGSVLFEKAADQLIYPASLAKLMTAELVFHEITEGRLDPETEFVISENAWRRGGAPSGGSTMFAALHSRVKVRDLIRGVIVQSGNDACIALAEGMAGNEPAFAEMMNKRAREIGLTKSNFTDASGLHDPNLQVTTREIAKLAQYIKRTYTEYYKHLHKRVFN